MKKKILKIVATLILFATSNNYAQQQLNFRDQLTSKSNIIWVGKHGYIEKDKFLHSTAGAFTGSSVYMLSYYKTDRIGLSILFSVLSAFVVGETKELYDRSKGGKFSNDDLTATTFGGFSGVFTKIIQIGIQEQNKLTELEKEKYEDLNQPPLLR